MGDNPLVQGPVDTTTATSGLTLVDDGTQLANAIAAGDWVEGGIAAFSLALDGVAAVSDPLGTLIAHGLGWLIDHFEPLKGWFDDLTGDPGEVEGFAQTWQNVASSLYLTGPDLTRVVGDLDELSGEAMDAYRLFQQDAAAHLDGAGDWAQALSTGLFLAGTIVQLVHDLVRDVISQLVGSAISWAAEEFFTLGLATPWVIEQVSTRVASLAAKIGTKLTALLHSMRKLGGLLDELRALMAKVASKLDGLLRRGGDAPIVPVKTKGKYPPKGEPNTKGYDANGNRLPYANSRPKYAPGQVEQVFNDTHASQVANPPDGLPAPGADQIYTQNVDGSWTLTTWHPGEARTNVWDMGHLPGSKYSDLHDQYMNGEITKAEFLAEYRDPANYTAEGSLRNQSHMDEK